MVYTKKRKKLLTSSDQLHYDKNIFKIDYNKKGPQKQFVYILRFPISYKNNQLVSQRVNFTNYFDWMGQIREYSLKPISDRIIKLTKGGKWGLATNSVKLKVFDFLRENDVLEVRLWLDKISGRDNIYHLSFDWLRFLKANSYERVASSSIIITCVKIIGHGQAVITNPPDFLRIFFDNMKPKSTKKLPMRPYKTLFCYIDLGKLKYDYGKTPLSIFENSFQTSLENSNLIGNIYFSNYSKWINSTKDLFLYNYKPNIFRKTEFDGEFATLECKISYMQEAMPFDKILVKMYLVKLFEKGMVLRYEIFKVKANNNIKLAKVTQTIAFIKYKSSIPKIKAIPEDLMEIFKVKL